jgi:hypothetical protein
MTATRSGVRFPLAVRNAESIIVEVQGAKDLIARADADV